MKPPEKWESIALRFIGGQKAPTGKSKTLEKLWKLEKRRQRLGGFGKAEKILKLVDLITAYG